MVQYFWQWMRLVLFRLCLIQTPGLSDSLIGNIKTKPCASVYVLPRHLLAFAGIESLIQFPVVSVQNGGRSEFCSLFSRFKV